MGLYFTFQDHLRPNARVDQLKLWLFISFEFEWVQMSCCGITRKTVTWREFQRWYYYTGTSVSGNMDSSVEIGDRTARDVDRPFVPVPLFSLRREEWRANGSIMRSLAAVHAIMQGGLVADKETMKPGHLARLLPRKPKSFALLVGVACILSPCSRRRLWQIFKWSCQQLMREVYMSASALSDH